MINVIGLGYIGLPTALMMASQGLRVIGTDVNEDLVHSLNQDKLTFEEKGLQELFDAAQEEDIEFTIEYQKTDTYVITVPTPYVEKTKKVDSRYLIESTKKILTMCKPGTVVIIESTVSPGTIDRHVRPLIEGSEFTLGEDIHIAHAPERIIPGNMVHELKHNARTIGVDDAKTGEYVRRLYESFCEGDIVITDIRSAEMSKVVENTYRDVNIAFANELAKLCRYDDMDVHEIIRVANKHPRVDILSPGPGVGGHCISVDPWFLVGDYPEHTPLIKTARDINDSMPSHVLSRMRDIMKTHGIASLERVGLYGLTYKEDVDDTRESPSLQLLETMERHLAWGIKTYDPLIKKSVVSNQYHDFREFLDEVDFVVVMVSHQHILENAHALKDKIVLDTKNTMSLSKIYTI